MVGQLVAEHFVGVLPHHGLGDSGRDRVRLFDTLFALFVHNISLYRIKIGPFPGLATGEWNLLQNSKAAATGDRTGACAPLDRPAALWCS